MTWAKLAAGAFLVHEFATPIPSGSDHWAQVDVVIPATTFTACTDGDLLGQSAFLLYRDGATDGALVFDNDYPHGDWRWWTSRAPGAPAASGPSPGTTYTIKYHYNHVSGDLDWYVGGVLLWTDNLAVADTPSIRLGYLNHACPCEVYYFTNVKVGTSDGASDIFADSFPNLSQWQIGGVGSPTAYGAAGIVTAPGVAPCPTITLHPARGIPGDTITLTGSGFAPSSPLTLTIQGVPVVFSEATSDGSGNVSGTFIVPHLAATGAGSGWLVVLNDAEANLAEAELRICRSDGADGFTTVPDSVFALAGTFGDGNNSILHYLHANGAHWILWQDPSVLGANQTTFPPPANHALNVTRISDDGSSTATYPIDVDYCWAFDNGATSFLGACSPFAPTCTVSFPYWSTKFFFTGWSKPILDARLASDGETVWVAVLTTETVVYPYFFAGNGYCGFDTEFATLASITGGFSSFATSAGTGYLRHYCAANGALDLFTPGYPTSDPGDGFSGHWSPPRVVMFAGPASGGSFTRIGSMDAKYCPGHTEGQAIAQGGGAIVGGPVYVHASPRGSFYSGLSLAADPVQPGVCHLVWSEGGDWGTCGAGDPCTDPAAHIWDYGPPNRDYRVGYSVWAPSAKLTEVDLWNSHVNRKDWDFSYDQGGGAFATGYTWPDAGVFAAASSHVLRNDSGVPLLFISFFTPVQNAITTDGGLANPPAVPNDSHGNPWLDNAIAFAEDTIHMYDLSSGDAVLLQEITSDLLPDETECEFFYSPLGVGATPPQASDALYEPGLSSSSQKAVIGHAFGVSDIYRDPLLGGASVYLLHAPWCHQFGAADVAPGSFSMRGFYRVPIDGSAPFDFLDGQRQVGFTVVKGPGGIEFDDSPFFSDPRNLWVPSPAAAGTLDGVDTYWLGGEGEWFDRICLNQWLPFNAAPPEVPSLPGFAPACACPGFHYDAASDTISYVARYDIDPYLFQVIQLQICRRCSSCRCGIGVHIAHRF